MKKKLHILYTILLFTTGMFAQNNALDFDGTNDYVDIGGIVNNPNILTQEAWVKTTMTTQGVILTKRHANDGSDWPSILIVNGKAVISVDDKSYRTDIASTTSVNDGAWHHIAGVKNGSSYLIYVDGVLETSATDTHSMGGSTYNFHIGHHGAWGQYFNGQIDEVRVWDDARTASEISDNMNTELTGSESNLIAYYNMNEGSDTSLTDNSSNSNTGTLTNMDVSTDWVTGVSFTIAPTITNFNNITKTFFDASYTIAAPTSNSSGAFTYTSNNSAVATVSGTTVTLLGARTATITAAQAGDATYYSSSITSTLTVNSVSIVTKNGEFSTTNFNYVNKNGALSTSNSVTIYGQAVSTKSNDGNALNFSSGLENYITLPSAVYFNGNFTIECWVYPTSITNWSRIIDFGNGAANNAVLLSTSFGTSGKPGFYVGGSQFESTSVLPLNQWSHVAASLNGNMATIYIDGVASGTATFPTPANVIRNNNYIGRSNWGWGDPAPNASFDDLRIWNVARSQAEIQANMNNELIGNETGLIAYYTFNQGVAAGNNSAITTVTDKTANALTGTLYNFTKTGTTSNFVLGKVPPNE